jgi:hypothetical protein
VAALQGADSGVRVVVGGDLNVYPRPDDPFTPGHPLYPSDQLAPLYIQGLNNLFDVLVEEIPVAAYGYIFQGQTQTLDQVFTTDSLLDDLVQVRIAHINSDFPADYEGDGPRGTSDHDPNVARYDGLPTIEKLKDLVLYYQSTGDITGNKNQVGILLNRLTKAGNYLAQGKIAAYEAQLQAFINQVKGFTPKFITQSASDALVIEATLLLSLP